MRRRSSTSLSGKFRQFRSAHAALILSDEFSLVWRKHRHRGPRLSSAFSLRGLRTSVTAPYFKEFLDRERLEKTRSELHPVGQSVVAHQSGSAKIHTTLSTKTLNLARVHCVRYYND